MNDLERIENHMPETASSMRELQRVQAQVILAKKFPRDRKTVIERIEKACTSVELAGQSLYEYSRGGTMVSGPSIKLIEVVAQCYGNLDYGVVEISQEEGMSTFQAFAWDMETNVRNEKTFSVKHIRYSKSGSKDLVDPRDIYEIVANNGSRRVRACLQSVIPKDIVKVAEDEIQKTLTAKVQLTPEKIKRLLEAYDGLEVSKDDLEAFIGSRMDAITPSMFMKLTRIFTSIGDGVATKEDFFKSKDAPNSEIIDAKTEKKVKKLDPEKQSAENKPNIVDVEQKF